MKTQIEAIVVSATNYDIDGSQGASIFITQPTSGRNQNICGFEVLKMKAPFDLVQSKIDLGEQSGFPGLFHVEMTIERGSGGKARPVATGIVAVKKPNPIVEFIQSARQQKQQYSSELGVMTGLVLGATKYQIDNDRKGGKLFLLSPPDSVDAATWAGYSVATIQMDYGHFAELKALEKRLPGFLRVAYTLEHGSNDVPVILAQKIELAKPVPGQGNNNPTPQQ